MAANSKVIKVVLLLILGLGLILGISFMLNRPTQALYKFNSGLSLSFDLNKWRLTPNPSTGDTLENNTKDISIFLTGVQVEDKLLTLEDIVAQRISNLNKQNIQVNTSALEINGIPFFKIEYTDKGDENVKPDESGISFVTLYNSTYTTIQIFYKTDSELKDALDIVNSVSSN